MTGGYGCIGSWVAKQLADLGQEVWIYDLKEDTHRLDLILEPEQLSSIHFVAGDVSDAPALCGCGIGGCHSYPSPGGLADPDLPRQPGSGCQSQRDRHTGCIRGCTCPQ